MECLWVASPDTAAAIRAHHRGRLKPADLTKLALTTSRYLARLRSRATPFGLFAGVALGTVGEAAAIRLGDRHAKTGRPDGDCLAEVARRIESELAADGEVLLMAHPLCQVRGDRLERITATSTVTVRANALVQAVIRQLDRSRTMPELLAELDQRFPALGRDKILGVVRVLLAQGFLVSDVLADLTEADPLPRLCSLATTGTTGLSTAAEALGEYLKRPPGTAESELIGARERLTAVAGDGSPQVDLLVDAEVTVPAHVLTEAAAAATVLWRVSAPRSAMAELADFRDALMERYGYNVVVPIVEALDPVHGLDAPAGYRNPVSTRTVEANPPSRDVAVLGRLIQEATMEGRREIVLTEEVIAALDEDPQSPVWRSTSLNFHLLADSTDAIDRGDYTVLCAAGGLSRRAGQVHGRFVHALGAVDTLTDVFAADGEAGGVEQVQLSYRPVSDRMSNVMRVPRLTARTVSLDSPTPAELRVGDLGVCADESGLAIVSLHDGAELEACAGHMANSGDFAPNIARFISEVELLNTRVAAPWSWRDLEALPFLPRVRHGRVVLRPCRG
ncbi:MAG: lantibiotic dehydratase family protein, partial [Stackebrandtia sp.]